MTPIVQDKTRQVRERSPLHKPMEAMFGSTLPPAAAAAVAEGASLTRKQQGASAGGACYEHRVPVGTPTSTALFGEKVARTRNLQVW